MTSAAHQASRTVEVVPLSQPVLGDYTPPADLSVARIALAASVLCSGPLLLRCQLPPQLSTMLACLERLGVRVDSSEELCTLEGPLSTAGAGRSSPGAAAAELQLDCGSSEEELLLLAGVCTGLGQAACLRLSRELGPGAQEGLACLRQLGAELSYLPAAGEAAGCELRVIPAPLHSAQIELPAQPPYLNAALLLAACAAGCELTLREARSAHDHAHRLLRSLGVELYSTSEGTTLPPGQRLGGAELKLPGCPELASARAIAALLLPGSDLSIQQVSMNPRRSALLKLLHECAPAAREGQPGLARTRSWQFGHEPVAALRAVHSPRLRSAIILPNRAATLLDELPWLLLLASQGRGTSVLRGFERASMAALRTAYLAELLRSFGIDAEYDHDGWRISGPAPLLAAELQCLGDPLLSRCALLLARFADGPSLLHGAVLDSDPLDWAAAAASAEA